MKQKKWYLPVLWTALPAAPFLLAPREMADGVRQGLSMCGTVVIPSLFPFFVLCTFLVRSGISGEIGKILARPTAILFRLPPAAAGAVLFGLCGGYPVGARTTAQLYAQGELTAAQAERMCLFCVTAGPAFVVGTVGAGMLHNAAAGRLLLAVVTLSCLTLGILLRFTDAPAEPRQAQCAHESLSASLCAAVADGGKGMLSMCAWVILFSGICGVCSRLPGAAGTALGCVLEVTGGCRLAGETGMPLPLIAGILGFGGLSVQCQILPYVTSCGVRLSRFWAFRVLHGGLAAVYAMALGRLFPQSAMVMLPQTGRPLQLFSASAPASAALLFTAAVFILNTAPQEKSIILRKS